MTVYSEERTIKLLKDQIAELEEEGLTLMGENDSLKAELQSLKKWASPASPGKGELEQRLRQEYQSLREILNNEGVQTVYSIVVDDLQRLIFNTQPGDTEKREQLYYQAQGLQSVWVKMGSVTRGIKMALEKEVEEANR